jgi:integrase
VKKELLPMKKDQIDFLNAVLWIPHSKTPNGVAEIPLTKLALEAFQKQVAISGNGEFPCPSDLNQEGVRERSPSPKRLPNREEQRTSDRE